MKTIRGMRRGAYTLRSWITGKAERQKSDLEVQDIHADESKASEYQALSDTEAPKEQRRPLTTEDWQRSEGAADARESGGESDEEWDPTQYSDEYSDSVETFRLVVPASARCKPSPLPGSLQLLGTAKPRPAPRKDPPLDLPPRREQRSLCMTSWWAKESGHSWGHLRKTVWVLTSGGLLLAGVLAMGRAKALGLLSGHEEASEDLRIVDFRAHLASVYVTPEAAFRLMDEDGDDNADLKAFLLSTKTFWPSLNPAQATYAFMGLDCNKDSLLNSTEFVKGLMEVPEFFTCIGNGTTNTSSVTTTHTSSSSSSTATIATTSTIITTATKAMTSTATAVTTATTVTSTRSTRSTTSTTSASTTSTSTASTTKSTTTTATTSATTETTRTTTTTTTATITKTTTWTTTTVTSTSSQTKTTTAASTTSLTTTLSLTSKTVSTTTKVTTTTTPRTTRTETATTTTKLQTTRITTATATWAITSVATTAAPTTIAASTTPPLATTVMPVSKLVGTWQGQGGSSYNIRNTGGGQMLFSIRLSAHQQVSGYLVPTGRWLQAELEGVGSVRLRLVEGLVDCIASRFKDAGTEKWGPETTALRTSVISQTTTTTPSLPTTTTVTTTPSLPTTTEAMLPSVAEPIPAVVPEGKQQCTFARPIPDGRGGCTVPTMPSVLTFYMYRAQDSENYEIQNNNLGNLAGVMWYLHHEVVPHCPRHYGITRILRLRVTMKITLEVFNAAGYRPLFGPFVAMDSCRCTTPNCPSIWQRYGYVPGCQEQNPGPNYAYPLGVWYSLPGPCPSQDCRHKSPQCKALEPGGKCMVPDGSRQCTWHLESAGEILLDELTGILDHASFCKSGKREFVPHLDHGIGAFFWDGFHNSTLCKQRVEAAERLFASKYPSMPMSYPMPKCLAAPR